MTQQLPTTAHGSRLTAHVQPTDHRSTDQPITAKRPCSRCRLRPRDKPHGELCADCRNASLHKPWAQRRRYTPTAAIDAAIVAAWRSQALHKRACRAVRLALGRGFDWPAWAVKRRAIQLGVAKQAKRGKTWSPAELMLLEERRHLSDLGIQNALKAAGFQRTLTAIHQARQRHRLQIGRSQSYTPGQLGYICGVDRSTVNRWITSHGLPSFERETARDNDTRAVHAADFRRWVFLRGSHRIDLRKVEDQEMFFWLLSGDAR